MKPFSTKLLRHLVPAAALLAAACSKEPLTEAVQPGNTFRFEVSRACDWNAPQQRATCDRASLAQVIALQGETPADTLFLHVSAAPSGLNEEASSEAVTRGVPVDDSTIESFAVFGYTYTGAWDTASEKRLYVREEAERARDWTLFTLWPGSKCNIRFFAMTPERHNFAFDAETRTIRCHIAPEAEKQSDLLVAATEGMSGNANVLVPLDFSHAMTAVKFVVGDDMLPGTIEKISISGIYGTGVYDFATGEWSDLNGKASYTFAPEQPVEVDDTAGTPITPTEATFMLLPQILSDDATIEVIYADKQSGFRQTLNASIAGTRWEMGQTVTYRISTSSIVVEPTFTVSQPEDWIHTEGSKTYTVTSYFTISRDGENPRIVPAPWTAEFFGYNDESGAYDLPIARPDWVTTFTASAPGSGTASGDDYAVALAAQTARTFVPHDGTLRDTAPVAGLYDLSTQGGTTAMNTANCYIINAPGRYSLPLVYGNAIKNGMTNAAAYTSSLTGPSVLTRFLNHAGNAITDPYICNNAGCTPADAVLVWQDEKELVTDVALSADRRTLTFEVEAATIKQGNALVAVRDAAGQTLWSWHIWVTSYVPGLAPTERTNDLRDKVVTNYQNVQYTMMPVNLGWCATSETHWDGRSVMVRFTQTGTSETREIILNQAGKVVYSEGDSPFWQWGRKDPMLPAAGTVNKTWYDAEGTPSTSLDTEVWETGDAAIVNGILHPSVYCRNSYMCQRYNNLWSVENDLTTANDNKVVKSVYDPCPVGYQMPASYAFTGFTTTGRNAETSAEYNVSGSFDRGWNFYCGKNRTGPTIYFPAAGYRTTELGRLYGIGHIGDYWTASPGSEYVARRLYFFFDKICPLFYYDRATGFPIRPCRE